MKKKVSILGFFILFLSIFNLSISKIAIINFNKIFKNSIEYQNFIKQLKIKINKKYIKLNNKINYLIKKEKEIVNKKKIINKRNLIILKDKINFKKNNIYKKINNLELKINKENLKIHKKILFKINNIINLLIKNKKIDLIIDSNVVIYNNFNILDITNNIIKKIN